MPAPILPQGGGGLAGNVNLMPVLDYVHTSLNASGSNDLIFWADTELYQYMDEGAQRLSRIVGCFVDHDTSLVSATNVGSYALPTNQVATVQADLEGTTLRPRTVRELNALDASWASTTGEPVAFVQDVQGTAHIQLYPAPTSPYNGLTIGLVLHFYPPTISQATPVISVSPVVQDYFGLRAIAGARGKQSKGEMPDVAEWLRGLGDWMEQVMLEVWGGAQ